MKRAREASPDRPTERLLLAALEEATGPAIVLDTKLEIVAATASAAELVGSSIPRGVHAAKVLCGSGHNRPLAEALARGVPTVATVERPAEKGESRSIRIRTTPLEGEGARLGWLLGLDADEESAASGPGPVLFESMWTRDASMKHVFHVIERAAARDATVLVRGETGTGKELVGRALHSLSSRRRGPFAAINCAALPESLLESELFGYVRGAFTGATSDRPGFFQTASGGTLFLDEVGEMPLPLQAKLLRALETHAILPVGARDPVPVDVRIVAATHRSLRRAVDEGRFRSDLMYRLRVIPIFLPPLRQRVADVVLLADKLVLALNAEGGRQIERIAPAARAALEAYPWPGNVRELRNALEYAYVIGDGPVLLPTDLPREVIDPASSPDGVWESAVNASPPAAPDEPPEVTRIKHALERAAGNRERAAESLGISRVTLWRRMRDLGIE